MEPSSILSMIRKYVTIINMNSIKTILGMAALFVAPHAVAQQTYEEMPHLTVNSEVTTVLTASEPVRFVDISTGKVVGDQPIENVVRLKPRGTEFEDGEIVAIVTVITERYRSQYALVYTTRMEEAVTDKQIEPDERTMFENPEVSLSREEMIRFSRIVLTSPATYRDKVTRMHRMKMRLNNVYTFGDYFFIDFSVTNNTNLKFDIDQLRVKLSDKKVTKATNNQTLELTPALVLDERDSFRHGYRNVIVLKKMTFPDAKVLTIELSEKQISGRTIFLDIDYTDILSADSFDSSLLIEK